MTRFDAIVVGAGHNGLTPRFTWQRPGCTRWSWTERRWWEDVPSPKKSIPRMHPAAAFQRLPTWPRMLRPEVIRDMDLGGMD